jgi:hypothetical protein
MSFSFSNHQRFNSCGLTVDVVFMELRADNVCHLCFSSPVIFRNILLIVNVGFRPLFLFTVVFPRFVYADITLQTVALDTPHNEADAPAKLEPTI